MLAVGIFIVSVVPLTLFACGSIGYVKTLSVREVEATAQQRVAHGARELSTYLRGKVTLLSTLINLHPIEHLREVETFASLLQMVNDNGRDSDIIALQLLAIDGSLLAHAGSSHEEDSRRDYKEAQWFNQVLMGGVAVSDVFVDQRGASNFIIALSDRRKTCVLRATINPLLLEAMLGRIQTTPNNEAYLLSVNGAHPAAGLKKQGHLNAIEHRMLKNYQQINVVQDKEFLYTSKWFNDSNWKLFLKTHFGTSLDGYYTYRNLAIYVVLVLSACSMLFSMIISRVIVRWIEKRDQQQKLLYSQLVHVEIIANIARIAASVAKDIGGPLQQIQKQADRVVKLHLQEETRYTNRYQNNQDALEKIQIHARCIRTIIDRLARFSQKIDSEYDIQLNWILREFLSFYEKEAEDRNIAINLHFDEQLPTIRTDGTQVQRLILDLIENALDAVGSDGQIDIITYCKSGEVCVQISDSGPGITSERMERLWQPFVVSRGASKGMGLNLSMYSNIVYTLGGKISTKDRPQGGMIVTLSLPVRG